MQQLFKAVPSPFRQKKVHCVQILNHLSFYNVKQAFNCCLHWDAKFINVTFLDIFKPWEKYFFSPVFLQKCFFFFQKNNSVTDFRQDSHMYGISLQSVVLCCFDHPFRCDSCVNLYINSHMNWNQNRTQLFSKTDHGRSGHEWTGSIERWSSSHVMQIECG